MTPNACSPVVPCSCEVEDVLQESAQGATATQTTFAVMTRAVQLSTLTDSAHSSTRMREFKARNSQFGTPRKSLDRCHRARVADPPHWLLKKSEGRCPVLRLP